MITRDEIKREHDREVMRKVQNERLALRMASRSTGIRITQDDINYVTADSPAWWSEYLQRTEGRR